MTINLNGNLTIDEAVAIEANSGTLSTNEDNDVASVTISNTDVSNYLANLTPLASSTGFPQYAERTDMIPFGPTTTDFALVLSSSTGVDTEFKDINGKEIFLFASADGNVVVGRAGTFDSVTNTWSADPSGTVALAIFLDETKDGTGHITAANLGVVMYEPLFNNDGTKIDDDDTLNLSGLVTLRSTFDTTTIVPFNDFSTVPSGQDVWTAIESSASGITDPDILVTAFTRTGSVETQANVNVSTTGLGVNSQATDPQEGLRIDFVNHARNGLTAPQVHDSSFLTDDQPPGAPVHVQAGSAGFSLTQVNPTGKAVNLVISAFDTSVDYEQQQFLDKANAGANETQRNIASVKITIGTTVFDTATTTPSSTDLWTFAGPDGTITVNLAGLTAAITGVKLNYQIDFTTSGGSFDRFEVYNSDTTGNRQFDVGNIHVATITGGIGHDTVDLGAHLIFEDDGPTIQANGTASALQVDESYLVAGSTPNSTKISETGDFRGLFTPNYGADGAGSVGGYTLGVKSANVDSGLIDSLSGQHVLLSVASSDDPGGNFVIGDVIGTTSTGGDLVFSVHVDSTGHVTFAEYRAVKEATADTTSTQGSVADSSEASATMAADLITLSAIATDKDGDTSAPASANIGNKFQFLDDGPSLNGVESLAGQDAQHPAVGFTAGSSGSDTFSSPDGADGAKVTIVAAAAITGLTQEYNTDHTSVTYKDSGGNGVYSLTVTDTDYTFQVLKTLTNPPETLDFSSIKSGSPVETLNVGTSGGHNIFFNGLLFNDGTFYTNPSGALGVTQSENDLNHANLGPSNPADDLNPDNIGFGVKNGQASQINMNEGFFFNESSGLDLQNFAFDVAGIGNINSIKAEVWLFNSAGELIDYQNPTISGLKQANYHLTLQDLGANVSGTNHDAAGESFSTGYIRFYFDPADSNAGVRIINFTTQVAAPVHDQDIQFQVANTDNDGDKALATFNVLVDNPNSTTVDHHLLT
jgi:hypothetical protein